MLANQNRDVALQQLNILRSLFLSTSSINMLIKDDLYWEFHQETWSEKCLVHFRKHNILKALLKSPLIEEILLNEV